MSFSEDNGRARGRGGGRGSKAVKKAGCWVNGPVTPNECVKNGPRYHEVKGRTVLTKGAPLTTARTANCCPDHASASRLSTFPHWVRQWLRD